MGCYREKCLETGIRRWILHSLYCYVLYGELTQELLNHCSDSVAFFWILEICSWKAFLLVLNCFATQYHTKLPGRQLEGGRIYLHQPQIFSTVLHSHQQVVVLAETTVPLLATYEAWLEQPVLAKSRVINVTNHSQSFQSMPKSAAPSTHHSHLGQIWRAFHPKHPSLSTKQPLVFILSCI